MPEGLLELAKKFGDNYTYGKIVEVLKDRFLDKAKVKEVIDKIISTIEEYKVNLFWNKESKYNWFCSHCGNGYIRDTEAHCWNHIGLMDLDCLISFDEDKVDVNDKECPVFNKLLGTVEITEVFEIKLGKNKVMDYRELTDSLNQISKRDGFKSAEQMFKYFNKEYDLSSPKKFYVYRWKWLKSN